MFKHVFIYLILFGSLCSAEPGVNLQIKNKLIVELKELQKDLSSASKEITKLNKDKAALELSLRDMEAWGNTQEEEKTQYYEEAFLFQSRAEAAESSLDKEKKNNLKVLEKYHKIKTIMALIFAGFLTIIYINYGAKLVSAFSPLLGPYSILLPYLGPIAVFALGYFTVFIAF